ncbi:MAG TPA: hypothetical protein VEB40_06380, partial [Flavipsychrobacter sp.]|nr:hypothetical protein [Flavipsychrobacter sp.]
LSRNAAGQAAHHDMQFLALVARSSPGSYKLPLSTATSQQRTRAERQTCGGGEDIVGNYAQRGAMPIVGIVTKNC